jgi:hypothetical protein
LFAIAGHRFRLVPMHQPGLEPGSPAFKAGPLTD